MNEVILTKSEQRAFDILFQKSDKITSRDEIAQSVWGNSWLEKYSDWQIDRLIYLLRKKISGYKIKTLRNSGYILTKDGINIPEIETSKVEGTLPTLNYLEYMNNPKNKRKTIRDLFKAMNFNLKANKILAINSYSYDNIDALYQKYPKSLVYFSNFDKRALKLHQDRIENLNIRNFSTVFDDIRNSVFKDNFFDLIINDFRLNFNANNKQNIQALKNMHRILKPNGKVLVSIVIDPRYKDNETRKDKPYTFAAEEGLMRKCFTIAYYKKLFTNCGFKIKKEFDIDGGKKWNLKYKRYLLIKVVRGARYV